MNSLHSINKPPHQTAPNPTNQWIEASLVIVAIASTIFATAMYLSNLFFPSLIGFSLSGILLIGEIIYRVKTYSSITSQLSKKTISDTSASLPAIPLKDRLEKDYYDAETDLNCSYYSLHRPEGDKLDVQLDFAIREGFRTEEIPFCIDLKSKIIAAKSSPYGVGLAKGKRKLMEDTASIQTLTFATDITNGEEIKADLAVVCDGHGDQGEAGAYIQNVLAKKIQSNLYHFDDEEITNTLMNICLELNTEICSKTELFVGTTLCAALIFADKIYVCNVGNSRAILCKPDGGVYQLSEDAHPNNWRFARAVSKNYSNIEANGGLQVIENLCLTRDLGIGMLSARPKITRIFRDNQEDDLDKMSIFSPEGSYLVIASDGLWNHASTQQVGEALYEMENNELQPNQMAHLLIQGALQSGSTDNIAVVVVKV